MNTELPNKAHEAFAGYQAVRTLSQKAELTDGDVNTAIETAEPMKDYYQTYQPFLGMTNSRYNALTGPFTGQRNKWWQHTGKRSEPLLSGLSALAVSPGMTGMAGMAGMSEMTRSRSDHEVNVLRREIIVTTRNFLQQAYDDLQGRMDPARATRGDDHRRANEVRAESREAMGERWRVVIAESGMEGVEVPDQSTDEWAHFASIAQDRIVDKKNLGPRDAGLVADVLSGGTLDIADILKNGTVFRIEDADRQTEVYKGHMKSVLEEYQDFRTNPERWTE
jgi:hypothetical protein